MFEKRSIKSVRPNGWTQEMLNEFLRNSDSNQTVNNLLVLTRVQRQLSHHLDKDAFEEMTFYGLLGAPDNSPLRFVRVSVHTLNGLDELRYRVQRREDLPPLAKGYLHLSERKEMNGQLIPTLHINLVGGKQLASELWNSLTAAKQFGNTHLPLSIWSRAEALHSKTPAEVIEPRPENLILIESWTLTQVLDLHGSAGLEDAF